MSRTNLALFEKALGLRSRGIPFFLEGNIGAIFGRILDVYWLSEGEHDRIRDTFIQSFENLEALEIYSRGLDDFQLAGILLSPFHGPRGQGAGI